MCVIESKMKHPKSITYHIPLSGPSIVMNLDALSVENLADRTEAPSVHGVLSVNEAALVIASLLIVLLQHFELFV